MTPQQRSQYDHYRENLARERDILETAKEEGIEEGEYRNQIKSAVLQIEEGFENKIMPYSRIL